MIQNYLNDTSAHLKVDTTAPLTRLSNHTPATFLHSFLISISLKTTLTLSHYKAFTYHLHTHNALTTQHFHLPHAYNK